MSEWSISTMNPEVRARLNAMCPSALDAVLGDRFFEIGVALGCLAEDTGHLSAIMETAETGLVDRVAAIEAGAPGEGGIIAEITQVISDVETAETGLLDRVDALEGAAPSLAVLGPEAGWIQRTKRVKLDGGNPTPVVFNAGDSAAQLIGTIDGPYVLDNGLTFIVNANAAGDVTKTFTATAGTSTGGANPVTDMHLETDTKLMLAIDGLEPVECTMDWTGCTDGATTAAQLQIQFRLQPGGAAITVVWSSDHYVVTSGTKGSGSGMVITPAVAGNCTEELKLGDEDGGTEVAGTGDAVNIAETTAEEVATLLDTISGLGAEVVEGKVVLTSDEEGAHSSLVINAGSTAEELVGFLGGNKSAVGVSGFGLGADMADTDYGVQATIVKAGAPTAGTQVAIGGHATTGFDIYCENTASADVVELLLFGKLAAV